MSWGSDSNANRFKKSYIQGFLDVSGGNLIVESSSQIQVMSSQYTGQAALLIKPDRFSVFTGQSSYDISYVTFAALGFLGVSYQYTTADIYNRIKFIGSNTLTGNVTLIGSDLSGASDLVVYGNISTQNNGNITGARHFFLTGDASLNQKLYVAGNANMNSNVAITLDLSVNQNVFVTGRSSFTNDVSMNGNVDIGAGNNSVAINKDISENVALDVSGSTVLRGPLSITGDTSFNRSLQIGSDLSLNRFLYVNNNALFNTDVSINQNLYVSGRASIGRPPTNTTYELDVSGQMRIYEPSGTLATATSGSLVLQHGDASGVSSIVFRSTNDSGSDYAYIQYQENVGGGATQKGLFTIGIENESGSGVTADRISLYAAGGSGFVGVNTKDPLFNLDVSGNARITGTVAVSLDVSLNKNVKLGSGSNSVAINKDISSSFALDVSGITNLRAPLYTLSDVSFSQKLFVALDASFNQNLSVGQDVSINRSLYVVNRALFSSDVSINGFTKHNNSVSINKDISSSFALDVSGITNLRAPLYTLSDVSFSQKLFVALDASFNQNLSIGQDVSINRSLYVQNRALFSNDVSLNRNVKLGTGSNSIAVNKDISSNFALDVSGTTVLRGQLSTLSDVSINGKLSVSGDISFNGNVAIGQIQTIGIGLKQPPAPMTANVTNIPGHGSYYAYTSSLSADSPYLVFDNSFNSSCNSASAYNNPVGDPSINVWAGTDTISDVSAVAYPGYRYHIDLPYQINLSSFTYTTTTGRYPVQGTMLGSNNGTSWFNIFSFDLSATLNNSTTQTGTPPFPNNLTSNTSFYSKYAFVVRAIGCPTFPGNRFTLRTLELFGNNNILSTQGIGTTSLGVSDNLTVGSTANLYGNVTIGNIENAYNRTGAAKLLIMEPTGTVASATSGSLVLQHGDASGVSSIVFRSTNDVGNDFAYIQYQENVGGATQKGLFTIGIENDSGSGATADRMSLYAAGGSGFVGVNTLDPQSHFDVSGNARISGTVTASLDVSLNRNVKLGTSNNSVAINKDISSSFALDVSGITNLRAPLYALSDVSLGQKLFLSLDASFNQNLSIGQDVSINRSLYVQQRALFSSDVSINGFTKHNNSVSINKDISSSFALDVSGITNLRGPLYTLSDVSLGQKLFVSLDASFNQNLSIGQDVSINRFLYVNNNALFNKDVSTNQNLYVSGKATFGRPPTNTSYELDLSGQMRIYEASGSNVTTSSSVASLTLEHGDASGCSSIMFTSPSTLTNGDYAYIKYQDLSGTTTNAGLLTIGIENDTTAAATRDRISLYAAGGSGFVGVNTLDPSFNLDVSGNANVRNTLITNTIDVSNSASNMDIAVNQISGTLNIGTDPSRNGTINIGTGVNVGRAINIGTTGTGVLPAIRIGNFDVCGNSIRARSDQGNAVFSSYNTTGGLRIGESMTSGTHQYSFNQSSGSVQIAGSTRNSGNIEMGCGNNNALHTMSIGTGLTNAGLLNIANGATSTGSVNIMDGSGSTGTTIIGRYNAIRIVNSTTTTVDISAAGQLTLRGSTVRVFGSSLFNSDVSLNQNVKLGSGNNSIAVNKDISSSFALDVSGITNFRGPLYALSDVSFSQKLFVSLDASFNQNLFIGQDVSINRSLYVNNNSLFNGDVSTNQNLYVSGKATFGRPPTDATYELDLSGQMRIYEASGSNVTTASSVATLTLEHGDASGCSSIMFKSPSTLSNSDYAYIKYQDLSGATTNAGLLTIGIENDTTGVNAGKISLYSGSGSGFVGVNTVTPTFNFDISGNTRVTLDASFNRNVQIGAGNNSIAINKAISSIYALDVSGTTNFSGLLRTLSDVSVNGKLFASGDVSLNQKLFVSQDASFNQNLSVGQDVSINRSLYVVNRALFSSDVSINGFTKHNNSVSINKDISSSFALDVSGITNLRAPLYTLSDVSLGQKLFVSLDASFNQNLAVGQDVSINRSLYVVNRALFSSDVSLNRNVKLGSGNNSVAINKDISSNFALDVSGLTALRGDVSMNGTLFANDLEPLSASSTLEIAGTQTSGILNIGRSDRSGGIYIGTEGNTSRVISIGSNSATGGTTYISGSSVRVRDTGNADFSVGRRSTDTTTDSMVVFLASGVNTTGNVNILDGAGSTATTTIGRDNAIRVVNSATTTVDISAQGLLTLRGSRVNVIGDVSVNQKLNVLGKGTFGKPPSTTITYELDVSGQMRIYEASGSNVTTNTSVATLTLEHGDASGCSSIMFTSPSTISNGDYAYIKYQDLSGATTNAGLLTIGIENDTTAAATRDRISLYAAGGSGFVGVNTLDPAFNLDVSGQIRATSNITANQLVASGLTTNTIAGSTAATAISLFTATTANISIGGATGSGNLIAIGTSASVGNVRIGGNIKLGYGTTYVGVNKDISTAFLFDVSGDSMFRNKLFVNSDASFGTNVNVGQDLSVNRFLYINNNALFNGDVSTNQNLYVSGKATFGRPPSTNAAYELDLSGQMRIYEEVGSNVTTNTSVGTLTLQHGDASGCSSIMFTSPSTVTNGDYAYIKYQDLSGATTNAGLLTIGIENDPMAAATRDRISLYAAGGSGFVGVNTLDPSFNLDVSGNVNVSNTLITNRIDVSNSASNMDIAVNQTTGILNIGTGARNSSATGQVNINNNGSSSATTTIGGGTIIISGSGNLTFNTSYGSPTVNIVTATRNGGVFNLGTGDPSGATTNAFSGNATNNSLLNIATGSRTAGSDINIASNTSSAETLNIGTGAGRTGPINIGTGNTGTKTIGLGGSLTTVNVVGRSVTFASDVSLNSNTRLGTGSNSIAINKDISSNFALDVSGLTNLRGNLTTNGSLSITGGSLIVNGVPVSGASVGTVLTTQGVQVGNDTNYFVTIDKPNFYNDPSLVIYYSFDTSFNDGTQVRNMADPGTYDGSLNGFTGSTTGMINTSVFKYGTASLNNNSTINQGVQLLNSPVSVSSTMSFSLWVNFTTSPNPYYRIFEFTDHTAAAQNLENNTIALDISANGVVYPVLTHTGTSNCFATTLTSPIVPYNLQNTGWNHITWLITPTRSSIYVNGSIKQVDVISTAVPNVTRANGALAFTYLNSKEYNGFIDEFRYYKDKALNQAEIFQLNRNTFYNLDICGGFLANGSSVIYEPVGSKAGPNSGSLTLIHGDASGSSSIMFKSVNDPSEYGYIQYEENSVGSTGVHYGLMTIGIENDTGVGSQADRISLFPSGGTGFVGVNTKTPQASLDVSGQLRILEGAGTSASPSTGSLVLEHTAVGGTSSIMFKGPNSTTSDYAYVQYTDASSVIQSLLKYDLSSGTVGATGNTNFTSTGTNSSALFTLPTDNSFAWIAPPSAINGITPAVCISFNQTNLNLTNTTSRINYLQTVGLSSMSSFTFSAWIRPGQIAASDASNTPLAWMIANLTNGNSNGCVDIWLENNGRIYALLGDDGVNYINTTSQLALNTWYHIVFTFDGNLRNGFLYLNGALNTAISGTALNNKALEQNSSLILGMKWGFNTGSGTNEVYGTTNKFKGFRGQMAFVNVFDRGISASDVQYLYNNPAYNLATIPDRGLMTIGIENENGSINNDRIVLWPGAGSGSVGVNTRTPRSTLDISGTLNVSSTITSNNGTVVISGQSGAVLRLANQSPIYNSGETLLDFYGGEGWRRLGGIGCNDRSAGFDGQYLSSTSFYTTFDTSYNLEAMRITGNSKTIGNVATVQVFGDINAQKLVVFSSSLTTSQTLLSLMNLISGNVPSQINMDFYVSNNTTYLPGRIACNQLLDGGLWYSSLSYFVNYNGNSLRGMTLTARSTNTVDVSINGILDVNGSLRVGTDMYMNNDKIMYAVDTAGTSRAFLWPRASDNIMYINYGGSGFNIRDNSSNSRMFMKPNGSIGINTTTPSDSYKLHVSGNTLLSGTAVVGSNCQIYSNSNDVFVQNTNTLGWLYLQSNVSDTTTTNKGIMIDKNGNVGIKVGPNASYALDVSGNVQATNYNATSDYRIKKNLVSLDLTFNVDLLNPVSYYLKDDKDARLNIGFIAHEVQEVYPFLVNGVKDGSFNQSINYNGFIGILTKEIQVLKKKVSDQEERLASQEAKALDQEERLASQETKALEQEARLQVLEKMLLNK